MEAKNAHTILAHSLREKTKDDDLVRRSIAKRKKEVQVSNNVGLIAAGLRNKQMQINNGQFNTHVSLEAVSFFGIVLCVSNLLLTFVTRSSQSYDTLIGGNALMHSSQQPPAAVHHYQVQERAMAPVYHRPTPSPLKRRQDTLTQNEWGARPIPSGWVQHTDGSGETFYINRKTKGFAPTYEHMFVDEEEAEPEPNKSFTQRSTSSSANSQEEETYSPRKKSRRKERDVSEVRTEDLPGSDFSIQFAQRNEAREANKENDSQSQNLLEVEHDADDNNGNHNDANEVRSDQETQ